MHDRGMSEGYSSTSGSSMCSCWGLPGEMLLMHVIQFPARRIAKTAQLLP
jgi:hypothetical protein